jgi:hypothetical protein
MIYRKFITSDVDFEHAVFELGLREGALAHVLFYDVAEESEE